MRSNQILGWMVGASLLCALPGRGQEPKPKPEQQQPMDGGAAAQSEFATVSGRQSEEAQAAAPRVLKFSGVLVDVAGKPLSGEVEVTFALYKQEGAEEPLWTETQHVIADERGGYTALLGVTQATGMPAEVFRSDEARWLGVQVQGQVQQPRTLLVSVPYALKAVEAEKLAGKSASDFVLSENLGDQVRRVIEGQTIVANQATSTGTPQPGQTKANSTSTAPTTAGPMFPPSTFSGTNATQIVSVHQNGSGNGLYAQTASATGNSAVVGVATSNSTSNNQNGVIGFNAGAGAGVAGIATNPSAGVGVYGQSANFTGVFGQSFNSGTSGVAGIANATTGFSNGVYGQSASTNGVGVFGNALATSGSATGVQGNTASPGGTGVVGFNGAATGFAPGVSGNSASTNGVGVFGNALTTSGFGAGVFGLSNSINGTGVTGFAPGTGVFGSTSATSGFANGVFGQSFSTSGTGVAGFANASSGGTTGVFGDASASPNGTGVFGSASQQVGVGGQATATSGGPAYGVWGDSKSTDGVGVAGYADATTGSANGMLGVTASSSGTGVHGAALNTSGNPVGVFGTTVGTGGGIGVWGVSSASSGGTVGVRGDLESPTANGAAGLFLTFSPTSVAGQFANFSRQGLILQGLSGPFDATQKEVFSVDANGNLHITGNLTVDGTKSSTAKLQNGREVALYAVESPENWFEDFGSAELRSGVAWVSLDASFAEATNTAITYHVFLTPNGDSNGLYVARKTAAGFEVREHGGSGSNVAFDYRIVVKRRGYETTRMAEVQHDTRIQDLSRQHFRQLSGSEITNRAGATRTAPVIPAIRPVPQRPNVQQPPKPIIPQVPKVNVAQPAQPR